MIHQRQPVPDPLKSLHKPHQLPIIDLIKTARLHRPDQPVQRRSQTRQRQPDRRRRGAVRHMLSGLLSIHE